MHFFSLPDGFAGRAGVPLARGRRYGCQVTWRKTSRS
jgi:hypothetical protein